MRRDALGGTSLPDWYDYAACQGKPADWWFPSRGYMGTKAKRICRECPVREECLAFAVETHQRFGIWGGLSETERRVARRKRNRELALAQS